SKVARLSARAPQRPDELVEEAVGDPFAADAVTARPGFLRQVVRAEPPVDHRQVDGKIAVARFGLDRVMPVVVARHRHPALEPSGMRGEVGVDPRVTITSTRCSLEPAIQSIVSTEWCTAWKRHSHGTRWNARWMPYWVRSATSTQPRNCSASGAA